MVRLPISRVPGMKIATNRKASTFASAYRSATSSKISWLRRSRRYDWTARIPVMVSTKCTMVMAEVSRTRRYVRAEDRENQRTSASTNGKQIRHTAPSCKSRVSSNTATPTMVRAALTSPSKPPTSNSMIASMSLVSRETTRPVV